VVSEIRYRPSDGLAGHDAGHDQVPARLESWLCKAAGCYSNQRHSGPAKTGGAPYPPIAWYSIPRHSLILQSPDRPKEAK
jgi:hypothetical protein